MQVETKDRESSQISTAETSYRLKSIVDLFFFPTRLFLSIRARPTWVIPFLICAAFSLLQLAAKDNSRWDMFKEIINFITPQQLLLAASIVLFTHALKVFGLALAIWFALMLYSVKSSYAAILSTVSYSFLVIVPATMLKLPLIFAKQSPDVYLGAAAFLPISWHESPVLGLLEQVDCFTIWMLALLVLAIPVVTEVRRKRACIIVGSLYGIWLLIGPASVELINLN